MNRLLAFLGLVLLPGLAFGAEDYSAGEYIARLGDCANMAWKNVNFDQGCCSR